MFNHIGSQVPGDFGMWGAVANARFFCIHVPSFYALAGFGLAQAMGPAPKSKLGFVAARLSPMYPMYLVSLLLLLINTLIQCNPSTYDATFHYEAQPSDMTRGDFCEPSPIIRSYWGTLLMTVVVYVLGLQSWPLYNMTWFLSYYSWFSSVYYFQLFLYPWLYSLALPLRGQKRALLGLTAAVVLANYFVCAGFLGFFVLHGNGHAFNASGTEPLGAVDATARDANLYALAYYLFPPFWVPSFAMGICAAFLYDAYRPYLHHNAHRWGWLCDIITLGLVVQAMCTICLPQSMRPALVGSEDGLGIRAWAAILSRLYGPLMVLWLYAMAVGHGLTVRAFSSRLVVTTLAPISYLNYIFHQLIGQYYWLVTRNEWWSYWRYRKAFFWFSPAPVPTAWWEYFFIVALTTWWSMLMARVDPYLVSKWESGRRKFRTLLGAKVNPTSAQLTTLDIVLRTVESMSGATVEPSSTLAEVGLASVAAPVIINMLSLALPSTTIRLADLVAVDSVGELAALLDARLQAVSQSGV